MVPWAELVALIAPHAPAPGAKVVGVHTAAYRQVAQ